MTVEIVSIPPGLEPEEVVRRRVLELRLKAGMTQTELAMRGGVPQSAVSYAERTGSVTLRNLVGIARGLGCSNDYLLGASNNPMPNR